MTILLLMCYFAVTAALFYSMSHTKWYVQLAGLICWLIFLYNLYSNLTKMVDPLLKKSLYIMV